MPPSLKLLDKLPGPFAYCRFAGVSSHFERRPKNSSLRRSEVVMRATCRPKSLSRSVRVVAAACSLTLAAISIGPALATVYTLVPDSPGFDDSPFGFSGTITTDGSVGSFFDLSFVTDWNITLETPGDVDGVTTQTLTPGNGSMATLYGNLIVTPTVIRIPGNTLFSAILTFAAPEPGDEGLRFRVPYVPPLGTVDPDVVVDPPRAATIQVYDFGEENSLFSQSYIFLTVATALPEPSSATAAMLAACALGFTPRRSRRERI